VEQDSNLRPECEAMTGDGVHSLTKIDEHLETPYHCTRCLGAWRSVMDASRTPCPGEQPNA